MQKPIPWLTLAIGAFVTSGCLISEPPDLEDPQKLGPFVRLDNTYPPPGRVWPLERRPNEERLSPTLTISFRSEDLGEPVTAALHLDIGRPDYRLLIPSTDTEPSTFDQERDFVLKADLPDNLTGCHVLTAVLAHASSFKRNPVDGFVRDDERAIADSDSVSWTVAVYDGDPSTSVPVSACVQAGSEGE